MILPYDTEIIPLGISPTDLKVYVHTKTRRLMFIAILFIITLKWQQPRCPLTGKRINSVIFIQRNIVKP